MLPDKLSELIRIALVDLEKCEADDRYRIAMGYWHDPSELRGKCLVCLAGTVMAKTLGFPPDKFVEPFASQVGKETAHKLAALDYARTGAIHEALRSTGQDFWGIGYDTDIEIPFYEIDPAAFKQAMKQLVYSLEQKGF